MALVCRVCSAPSCSLLWRYDAGDKGLLGCDDIAGEPEKIEKRCRTQERIGVDATGREVRASIACKGVCRESCEGC